MLYGKGVSENRIRKRCSWKQSRKDYADGIINPDNKIESNSRMRWKPVNSGFGMISFFYESADYRLFTAWRNEAGNMKNDNFWQKYDK